MAKKWYVIHTYSGYENKVKANLERAIQYNRMQDMFGEVLVVTEDYLAVGLCERLRFAEDYRPAIAVMTNQQLPLSYLLPVLPYANDLEALAAEVVRMVRDGVLDPSLAVGVRRIAPKLQDDHVPLHVI